MGYISTLDAGPAFRAKSGITEVLQALDKFKTANAGVFWLDMYSFIPTYEGRDEIVEIWMDEWDAKHYGDARLAEFISTIIHPDSYTYLTFDGEDGAKWGYWITSGQVEALEAVWVLPKANLPLDEKIDAWRKAHGKAVIKNPRKRGK